MTPERLTDGRVNVHLRDRSASDTATRVEPGVDVTGDGETLAVGVGVVDAGVADGVTLASGGPAPQPSVYRSRAS
ncbi:MAG: hypothetical protein ACXVQJ_05140, partial [Actinomycetota bacterium]